MKASVVIATEDPFVVDKLKSLLTGLDYTPSFERIGSKTILKVLEQEIDFLILDLAFNDDNDLDIIKIIQKTRPRLPIVVLSENNSLDTLRKVSQTGVFYYAMKPVQIGEMKSVVNALERFQEKQKIKI